MQRIHRRAVGDLLMRIRTAACRELRRFRVGYQHAFWFQNQQPWGNVTLTKNVWMSSGRTMCVPWTFVSQYLDFSGYRICECASDLPAENLQVCSAQRLRFRGTERPVLIRSTICLQPRTWNRSAHILGSRRLQRRWEFEVPSSSLEKQPKIETHQRRFLFRCQFSTQTFQKIFRTMYNRYFGIVFC